MAISLSKRAKEKGEEEEEGLITAYHLRFTGVKHEHEVENVSTTW